MTRNLLLTVVVVAAVLFSGCTSKQQTQTATPTNTTDSTAVENISAPGLRFYIVSDWGFNGFCQQTEVADAMVRTANVASPKFIVSCGDNFQVNGVRSTTDPLWRINFEDVYKHPVFNVDWFPVLGNHDYKGNPQAEIDYSKISRRWNMPDRYYTFVKTVNDSVKARFIFLDTPAMLSEYRNHPDEYPDACQQDIGMQLKWLTGVLSQSKEQWVLVFGHHPLYSSSPKHGPTQELITYLKPIFDQYGVDFYFCGHDHDFQHLKPAGSYTEYIVTGTGGKIRETGRDENTLFSISKPGFTLISFNADRMKLQFIGAPGNKVYEIEKRISYE